MNAVRQRKIRSLVKMELIELPLIDNGKRKAVRMKRRQFMKNAGAGLAALPLSQTLSARRAFPKPAKRPNILFCIADDWGWPHAGVYGDRVIKTPAFDRLAREGVLFSHSYVSSPSCTPSRNAILTGQYHWRLKDGANLHSTLDVDIPVFPLMMEKAGYHVGRWRKSWGPGKLEPGGYVNGLHPAGKEYKGGFAEFLKARPEGTPFCFWLGASDPHRPYEKGSGKASGIDTSKIEVPSFYPDVEEIRSDIADYYFEVQRFDSDCAAAIKLLEETGELENTIIVMTGDNGMPFPRCKSNIYDMGVRMPLAIRWGGGKGGGRAVEDFVSFTDFAPTFLEAAGIDIPEIMTGRSLMPVLKSDNEGWVDAARSSVLFGKERHTPAQLAPSIGGYPCRAIRTKDYLYIWNVAPDRWPAGVPKGATHPMREYSDCDNGPTKEFLLAHRDDANYKKYFDLSFAQRPAEELYVIAEDPGNINNVAGDSKYASIKKELKEKLMQVLRDTEDPRVIGGGEQFDEYLYRTDYKLHTTP